MSVKYISAVWLLLLGLMSAPLAVASSDLAEEDDMQVNSTEAGESPALVATKEFFASLYHEAEPARSAPDDDQKSCVALDDEVSMLMPLTYRYVPGFYEDPNNAFSIWMGTVDLLDVPIWYGYLGFSGYKRHVEEERIHKVTMRIDALRRVKARKRCFEVF